VVLTLASIAAGEQAARERQGGTAQADGAQLNFDSDDLIARPPGREARPASRSPAAE
jgi:hypothetical protein